MSWAGCFKYGRELREKNLSAQGFKLSAQCLGENQHSLPSWLRFQNIQSSLNLHVAKLQQKLNSHLHGMPFIRFRVFGKSSILKIRFMHENFNETENTDSLTFTEFLLQAEAALLLLSVESSTALPEERGMISPLGFSLQGPAVPLQVLYIHIPLLLGLWANASPVDASKHHLCRSMIRSKRNERHCQCVLMHHRE